MTVKELDRLVKDGKVKESHTSLSRGYVSRKTEGFVSEYNGRFGRGYVKYSPNWESTQYCYVTYFLFN